MLVKPHLFFLNTDTGKLLITQFIPSVEQRTRLNVIFIPPFGEEANKSRKMIADFSRLAASQHVNVCLIDLFGTGDSEGDFSSASWEIWQQNIISLYQELKLKQPNVPIGIVGLRTGALLAIDCCVKQLIPQPHCLLLWQPALNGQQFMTQFMRMRLAAGMFNTQTKLTMSDLQQELSTNGSVEIAGYSLSQPLHDAICQLNYMATEHQPTELSIAWVEIGSPPSQNLKPISQKTVTQWQQHNDVSSHFVVADSFWQTQEITTASELTDYSIDYLLGGLDD